MSPYPATPARFRRIRRHEHAALSSLRHRSPHLAQGKVSRRSPDTTTHCGHSALRPSYRHDDDDTCACDEHGMPRPTQSNRMRQAVSYGPDPLLVGFWALIVSPPAWVEAYFLLKSPSYHGFVGFLWAAALPLLPVVFASRFRVTFAPSEFVYRRWAPTVRIPYSAIDRIEVANVTPLSREAVGAFIVTKDGVRLPFWPKLFPREAVRRFFALGLSR